MIEFPQIIEKKKRLLIQKQFKSITELSNQGTGTSFWDLGYAKLILNYFVRFCLFKKYDHETEEKANCGVPEVSKTLKSSLF